MEIDSLVSDGASIVFAVDQNIFHAGGNRFCVLCPLMTVTGMRFGSREVEFPNRGRVWWMLRDNIDETLVKIGAIWSGYLEGAVKFEECNPEEDKFQVQRRSIHPGVPDFVEILDLPVSSPPLDELFSSGGLPWPRPVLNRVVLRGTQETLGPLKASWSGEGRITVEALNIGKPETLKIATKDFDAIARVERFEFDGNCYDPNEPPVRVRLAIAHEKGLGLPELRRAGELVDFATDAQVLNWGLKLLGFSRSQAREVKELNHRLSEENRDLIAGDGIRTRLSRFKRLAGELSAVVEASEEAAAAAAASETFKELIEKHVERITAGRVRSEVESRRKEVEHQVGMETKKLETLRREMEELERERDACVSTMEEEIRRAKSDRLREIDRKEEDLNRRELLLRDQEKTVIDRIARVAARYRDEGDKVLEELLTQLPILQRAGVLGTPEAGGPAPGGVRSPRSLPPAFLSVPRPAGSLSEEEFFEQFKDVVQRRGFRFHEEDLAAFHVTVKTGGLTVLSGASGIGKSSLPRLYAEALGSRDEFLQVGVRPDWLDDRDVLGVYNPLAGRYETSPSGIVDHLIAAQEDIERERGGIYFVALDEMNLARVEHYFARFLGVLEQPLPSRNITLFSEGLTVPEDPYSRWRRIHIGENTRFLGTVNIDETTHFFSPKVLDRAAIVSFADPDLHRPPPASSSQAELGGITPVSFGQYRDWRRPASEGEDARPFFLEIDTALRQGRMGFGFRSMGRMLSFVASSRPFMEMDRALDFQLLQRVFPRCRRTGPEFDGIMERLRGIVTPDRFPRAAGVLERMISSGAENDYLQIL